MHRKLSAFTLWFLLAASNTLYGQSWPDKSVRVIISNSAGAAPDVVARIVADRLTRALGQSFVVDNRPGAESVLGAELAARFTEDIGLWPP